MTLPLTIDVPIDDVRKPQTNVAEYTVSELSAAVKRTVEDGFGRIRVRGEIGGFRGKHSSGHCYFTLKDADACIEAVIWKSAWARLGVKPEDGLEVIATGRVTTFPKSSKYQVSIEQLEPAGVGALLKQLEDRRKRLAAEGLFDAARKRPLPSLPRIIGVITSPTGAVIRDILHRVKDRFPSHVIVWPVRVQGETCAAEVTAAIRGFATWSGPRPDVIIVARGGGSVEDLWGYNDEALVRAVADSPIPIVSAVGHETDWTLVDHAADFRAPTPTAAAERIVPVRAECLATLSDRARRLDTAVATFAHRRRDQLRLISRALPSGEALLAAARQRLDVAGDKLGGALFIATAGARARFLGMAGRLTFRVAHRSLERGTDRLTGLAGRLVQASRADLGARQTASVRLGARLHPHLLDRRLGDEVAGIARLTQRRDLAMARVLATARVRLATTVKILDAVSYQAVLSRGFALVRRATDAPVRAAAEVARGEALQIEFADGKVDVIEVSSSRAALSALRPVRRSKKVDEAQGVLL